MSMNKHADVCMMKTPSTLCSTPVVMVRWIGRKLAIRELYLCERCLCSADTWKTIRETIGFDHSLDSADHPQPVDK